MRKNIGLQIYGPNNIEGTSSQHFIQISSKHLVGNEKGDS